MSARDFRPIEGYPDQEWNANIRSEYGRNFIFLGCVIVLLVVFVGLLMILIKYFAKLFRCASELPSVFPQLRIPTA